MNVNVPHIILTMICTCEVIGQTQGKSKWKSWCCLFFWRGTANFNFNKCHKTNDLTGTFFFGKSNRKNMTYNTKSWSFTIFWSDHQYLHQSLYKFTFPKQMRMSHFLVSFCCSLCLTDFISLLLPAAVVGHVNFSLSAGKISEQAYWA